MHGAEAEFGLPAVVRGSARRVLSATSAAPVDLGRRVAMLRSRGHQVVLAPQSTIDAVREVHGWGDRVYEAVRRLLRERPTDSAGPAHLDLADRGCGGRGRRDHRRRYSSCRQRPSPH